MSGTGDSRQTCGDNNNEKKSLLVGDFTNKNNSSRVEGFSTVLVEQKVGPQEHTTRLREVLPLGHA